MSPDDYIQQRVDDQINWYDTKSQWAQLAFKRMRSIEIITAASIPVLATLAKDHPWFPPIVALLGAVLVLVASFLSLYQYQENWIEYRTTCESIKHEKYLYLTGAPPYDAENPFALFVQRVESLVSKENSGWSQYTRSGAETSSPRRPDA